MANHVAPDNWRDLCIPANEPALICSEEDRVAQPYHYWRGATGRRYLHTVYSLVDCPEIAKANFIMVRRDEDGTRTALMIGQTLDDAGALNLAHLRHQGAFLGANEIHIHLLAETAHERAAAEADLSAGQLGRRAPGHVGRTPKAIAV